MERDAQLNEQKPKHQVPNILTLQVIEVPNKNDNLCVGWKTCEQKPKHQVLNKNHFFAEK